MTVVGNESFLCTLCTSEMNSQAQVMAHLEGMKHRSKRSRLQIETGNLRWHCAPCNTTMTGDEPYRQHLQGKSHAKALKLAKISPATNTHVSAESIIQDFSALMQEANSYHGTIIPVHQPITKQLLQSLTANCRQ